MGFLSAAVDREVRWKVKLWLCLTQVLRSELLSLPNYYKVFLGPEFSHLYSTNFPPFCLDQNCPEKMRSPTERENKTEEMFDERMVENFSEWKITKFFYIWSSNCWKPKIRVNSEEGQRKKKYYLMRHIANSLADI